MPNWCENTLALIVEKRDKEKLEKLVKEFGMEDEIDLNRIVPEPTKKEDCDPRYIVSNPEEAHITEDEDRPWFNWYEWHIQYWGTKWNVSESYTNRREIKGKVYYVVSYETAWGPATPVIEKLIEIIGERELPITVESTYYEPGCMFGGKIDYNPRTRKTSFKGYDEYEEVKKFAIEEEYDDFSWEEE